MNYEEYAERMAAQKRKPVEREHYEECVEIAYMALGDVDKDEFCRLSGKAIAAIANLVRGLRREEKTAREAVGRARAMESRVDELERRVAELAEQMKDEDEAASREARRLTFEIQMRDKLIQRLAAKVGTEGLIGMMLE